jgi:SSS family solute:Na+ symporter
LSQLWTRYHTQIAALVQRVWPSFQDTEKYPINGYYMAFGITVSAVLVYIAVSMLTCKEPFDLDRMLHRGKHGLGKEAKSPKPARGLAVLGFTKNIPWKDKIVFFSVGLWFLVWLVVFLFFTIYQLTEGMADEDWSRIWQISVYSQYALTIVVTVWFLIGGARDCREMFARLAVARRDDLDDGMVVDHHSLGDEQAEAPSKDNTDPEPSAP